MERPTQRETDAYTETDKIDREKERKRWGIKEMGNNKQEGEGQ